MPGEVSQSPPLHEPNHTNMRPKGILKNPSFSGPTGQPTTSPEQDIGVTPPSASLDDQEAKELTLQNTLQNAGPRRSSSAGRRASTSRRHSSIAGRTSSGDGNENEMRLKWDEANLYLAEQEAGGKMKITEPKTPFEYGNNAMDVEDEEDISIDPRYVNVDEVDMAKNDGAGKKARESDIPGLELGDPEDESTGADLENDRIERAGSLSRENSKDKHVNLREQSQTMPRMTEEEAEKHKMFEEQRKKHYEMANVKGMLGNPENGDEDDDEPMSNSINGGR